jgi:hypothetical protein
LTYHAAANSTGSILRNSRSSACVKGGGVAANKQFHWQQSINIDDGGTMVAGISATAAASPPFNYGAYRILRIHKLVFPCVSGAADGLFIANGISLRKNWP